jgi:hypothetical protein
MVIHWKCSKPSRYRGAVVVALWIARASWSLWSVAHESLFVKVIPRAVKVLPF